MSAHCSGNATAIKNHWDRLNVSLQNKHFLSGENATSVTSQVVQCLSHWDLGEVSREPCQV